MLKLTDAPIGLAISSSLTEPRQAVALGDPSGLPHNAGGSRNTGGDDGPSGGLSDEDALQARLDALRRG